MKAVIVSNFEEAEKAVEEAEKEGLRLGAMSNAGLPQGKTRLTFLPQDAFKKEQ